MSDIVKVARPIVKMKPLAGAQIKLAKHSPEILIGVGIVSMVASTVLACRATLKAPEAAKKAKEKFAKIEEAKKNSDELVKVHGVDEVYSKKERQQDLVAASVQTGVDFVKLYGVPVVLMGAGIFMITKGHSITVKRNAALTSAFAALTRTMADYRERVRARLGEEEERHLYRNTKEEIVKGPDGKKHKFIEPEASNYPEGIYTRIFEEGNPCFMPTPTMNLQFLRTQERYWNDALAHRKIVFLNDVLSSLGFPIVKAGQAVGWIYSEASEGDGYISFGIQDMDSYEGMLDTKPIRFQLDFNVDGEVWGRLK